jgi:ribonuclease HI
VESIIKYGITAWYHYGRITDLVRVSKVIYKCARLILQSKLSHELLLFKSKIKGIDELYIQSGVIDVARMLSVKNSCAHDYAVGLIARDTEPRWGSVIYCMGSKLKKLFGEGFEMAPILDERHWRKANGDKVKVYPGTIKNDAELELFLQEAKADVVYTGDGSCDDNRAFYKGSISAGAAYIKTELDCSESKSMLIRCPTYSQAHDAEGFAYDAILDDIIGAHGDSKGRAIDVAATPDCLSVIKVIERSKVKCELHVRREAKLKFIEENLNVVQHIKHIKAHTGNSLNEAVDQCAKDACRLPTEVSELTLGVVKAAVEAEIEREQIRTLVESDKADVKRYLQIKKGVRKNNFYSDHRKREWRAVVAMQCGRFQPRELTIPAGSNHSYCRSCYVERGKKVPFDAIHFIKGCPNFRKVREEYEFIKGKTAAELLRDHELELLAYIYDCYGMQGDGGEFEGDALGEEECDSGGEESFSEGEFESP